MATILSPALLQASGLGHPWPQSVGMQLAASQTFTPNILVGINSSGLVVPFVGANSSDALFCVGRFDAAALAGQTSGNQYTSLNQIGYGPIVTPSDVSEFPPAPITQGVFVMAVGTAVNGGTAPTQAMVGGVVYTADGATAYGSATDCNEPNSGSVTTGVIAGQLVALSVDGVGNGTCLVAVNFLQNALIYGGSAATSGAPLTPGV